MTQEAIILNIQSLNPGQFDGDPQIVPQPPLSGTSTLPQGTRAVCCCVWSVQFTSIGMDDSVNLDLF